MTKNNSAADRVLLNGRIYTADTSNPWAEAIAIRDGKIAFVGADTDVKALIGSGTDVVDLKRRHGDAGNQRRARASAARRPGRSLRMPFSADAARSKRFSPRFAPTRARPSQAPGSSEVRGAAISPTSSRPSKRCARSTRRAKAIRFCCAMTACTTAGSIRARSNSRVSIPARPIRRAG